MPAVFQVPKFLGINLNFQVINAILLSIDAAFNFIPNIYITFVIVIWEGLMGGSIYVNTFYLISQKFTGNQFA